MNTKETFYVLVEEAMNALPEVCEDDIFGLVCDTMDLDEDDEYWYNIFKLTVDGINNK